MVWQLQTMGSDCIDRSICMRLTALHVAALAALLAAFAGRANAQATDGATTDPAQLISRWQAANTTCRSQTATAIAAVGACEQRDTLSKLLTQMDHCFGPTDKAGPATWTPCGGNPAKAIQDSAQARTTAQFHRMGGVFVLPAVINGSTKSYFIVDSGAANVQIPEEVADEMKRSGTLAESDFLGQRRFTLADGSGLQQRAEEPADWRPDDGERSGRRRGAQESRAVGAELLASTELVEDRQREERDGVRVHRIVLARQRAKWAERDASQPFGFGPQALGERVILRSGGDLRGRWRAFQFLKAIGAVIAARSGIGRRGGKQCRKRAMGGILREMRREQDAQSVQNASGHGAVRLRMRLQVGDGIAGMGCRAADR